MIEAELQGFGINYPGWDNGRPELLSKTLKIADNSTCREQSSKIYALPVNLEASQMCVLDTDRNVDNCVQNVGGPVTVCKLRCMSFFAAHVGAEFFQMVHITNSFTFQ